MKCCFVVAVVVLVVVTALPAPQEQDNKFPSFATDPNPEYSKGYPYPHPTADSNIFPFDYSCPGFCSGHGECINGKCECEDGYLGENCDRAFCANNCGGKGFCNEGVCECRKGWVGIDCTTPGCSNNCSGHGRCVEGDCLCDNLWLGHICEQPKYGIPGLGRAPTTGRIETITVNDTCLLLRIPPTVKRGSPELDRAELTVTHNGSCVMEKGDPHAKLWEQGKLVGEMKRNLNPGDHFICPIAFGCQDLRIDAFYGNSDVPEIYLNGDLQAPPIIPIVEGQVDLKYCFNECSRRGICMNKTAYYQTEAYECVCPAPWKVPCCCSKDREDNRPAAVDPLNETFPDTDFNNPPCSFQDNCQQCTQNLESTASGKWLHLGSKESCVWHVNRAQCVKLDSNTGLPLPSLSCRNHGLVFSEGRNSVNTTEL